MNAMDLVVLWYFGSDGTLVLWTWWSCGTLVLMVLWYRGSMVLWYCDPMVPSGLQYQSTIRTKSKSTVMTKYLSTDGPLL